MSRTNKQEREAIATAAKYVNLDGTTLHITITPAMAAPLCAALDLIAQFPPEFMAENSLSREALWKMRINLNDDEAGTPGHVYDLAMDVFDFDQHAWVFQLITLVTFLAEKKAPTRSEKVLAIGLADRLKAAFQKLRLCSQTVRTVRSL